MSNVSILNIIKINEFFGIGTRGNENDQNQGTKANQVMGTKRGKGIMHKNNFRSNKHNIGGVVDHQDIGKPMPKVDKLKE